MLLNLLEAREGALAFSTGCSTFLFVEGVTAKGLAEMHGFARPYQTASNIA
jgi:hypothetical protein